MWIVQLSFLALICHAQCSSPNSHSCCRIWTWKTGSHTHTLHMCFQQPCPPKHQWVGRWVARESSNAQIHFFHRPPFFRCPPSIVSQMSGNLLHTLYPPSFCARPLTDSALAAWWNGYVKSSKLRQAGNIRFLPTKCPSCYCALPLPPSPLL